MYGGHASKDGGTKTSEVYELNLTELKKWVLVKDNNEGDERIPIYEEDEKIVPPRNRHSAVVHQNFMFVFGGTTRNPEPAKYCNVYKLDLGKQQKNTSFRVG